MSNLVLTSGLHVRIRQKGVDYANLANILIQTVYRNMSIYPYFSTLPKFKKIFFSLILLFYILLELVVPFLFGIMIFHPATPINKLIRDILEIKVELTLVTLPIMLLFIFLSFKFWIQYS